MTYRGHFTGIFSFSLEEIVKTDNLKYSLVLEDFSSLVLQKVVSLLLHLQ